MTFLNPLVLLGLAAASIPLLLHLLNLRKLKTVEFSTLRFLKHIEKTQIRSLKLQQLLLLVLRMLIIIFTVLSFARPVIQSSVPLVGNHIPSSIVIVLDNSLSMDHSDERGNRFQQARRAALTICSALRQDDEVAVISSSMVGSSIVPAFSRAAGTVQENIKRMETAPRTGNVGAMLKQASALMQQAKNYHKEVYVITDGQADVLAQTSDTTRTLLNDVRLFVVPVGAGAKVSGQNLAVDSVDVVNSIFQIGSTVSADARIRNTSSVNASGVVVRMMFNGEAVAQRTIDVPAQQFRSLTLSGTAKTRGIVKGSIEIEGDAVALDNKRCFAFHIPPPPRVVLAGSDEHTAFLRKVFAVPATSGLFTLRTIRTSDLGSVDLENVDVLISTDALPFAQHDRIVHYIENGGSLMSFAAEGDDQTRLMSRCGFGVLKDVSFPPAQPGVFMSTEKEHPLFQGVFSATSSRNALVESPKIYRAMACSGGQSVISMAQGHFLVEGMLGAGRVIYCAVSPTPEWSSFPVTGLFPVIAVRAIPYAVRREQRAMQTECGEPVTLTLPQRSQSAKRVTVIDPSGTTTPRDVVAFPSASVVDLGVLPDVGVTVIRSTDGTDVTAVASNAPAGESFMRELSADAVRSSVASLVQSNNDVVLLDPRTNIADMVARERTGTELWRLFVVLAIACALAEMYVARTAVRAAQQSV